MFKFRRAIAIGILALLTSQSVMAGLGEHYSVFSGDEAGHTQSLDSAHLSVDSHAGHGQPGSEDIFDTNCCHAHGHCHVLGIGSLVNTVSALYGRHLVAAPSPSYHSRYQDPLLRPPATA
jgi:hypothetical protein